MSRKLDNSTKLVTVILAQNEIGTIQPVEEIVRLARKNSPGAHVHVDATQCAGKLPLNFGCMGADSMALSAHKFHGPRGIGMLVYKHCCIAPLIIGGVQQLNMRGGTEPLHLIVGLHTALKLFVPYSMTSRAK